MASPKGIEALLEAYLVGTLSATSTDVTSNIQQTIAAVSVTGSDRRTAQFKALIVAAGTSN